MHALIKFFSYWNIPYVSVFIIYFLFVVTAIEKLLMFLSGIILLLFFWLGYLLIVDLHPLGRTISLLLMVSCVFAILIIGGLSKDLHLTKKKT